MLSALSTQQIVRDALSEATKGAEEGTAAAGVLQQFESATATGLLMCTEVFSKNPSADGKFPPFGLVQWQPQAVAALSYAMVFEYAFQDLVTAAVQLLQMFMPGYQKKQFQQSRRAMQVLVRSMRVCLTSEGEQAVVTAVISLLALDIFLDSGAALQALTRLAQAGQSRSSSSKLADWAIVSLADQSPFHRHVIAEAGGSDVLVHALAVDPLAALSALACMAEHHSAAVWESLVQLSGLDSLVAQAQAFEVQGEQGLEDLAQLIAGLQALLQHPHRQEVVLQQLKASNALELLFVCAKAKKVAPVSQAATDCLVLIWQWYLRKSPSASFSDSQFSSFLGNDFPDALPVPAGMNSELYDSGAYASASLNDVHPAFAVMSSSGNMASWHGGSLGETSYDVIEPSLQQQQSQLPQQQQQQQSQLPLQQQQHSALQSQAPAQNSASQLWSVTPVVDFPASSREGSRKNGAEAMRGSTHETNPPSQGTGTFPAGSAEHQPAHENQMLVAAAGPNVNQWVAHTSRRSNSLVRRSFDAWNGLFRPSHRASVSAMASPPTIAQPGHKSSSRTSFASFRRPPKPSKGSLASKGGQEQRAVFSPLQPQAVPAPHARHSAADHPSGASHFSHTKPPVHPQVPACLSTPPRPPIAPPQTAVPKPAALQGVKAWAAAAEEDGRQHSHLVQAAGAQAGSRFSGSDAQNSLHTVKRRQPDALQYIQGWLDANPEGRWHPTGEQHSDQYDRSPTLRRHASMGGLQGSFTHRSPWQEEDEQPRRGSSAVSDRAEDVRQQILRASRTFGQAQGVPASPVIPTRASPSQRGGTAAFSGLTVLPEIPRKPAFTTSASRSPMAAASHAGWQTHLQQQSPEALSGTPSKADTATAVAPGSSQAFDVQGKSDAHLLRDLDVSLAFSEAEPTVALSSSAAPAIDATGKKDGQIHIPPTSSESSKDAELTHARSDCGMLEHGVAPQQTNGSMSQGKDELADGVGPQHINGTTKQDSGPKTPEPKRPAQRVLIFSPMSVTQPGAQADLGPEGKLHRHKQASPTAPATPTRQTSGSIWVEHLNMTQELTKGSETSRLDSMPWSATGSSMQTFPKLDSVMTGKTSFDGSSRITIDNVSKMSFDSQPISNITGMTASKSLQYEPQRMAALVPHKPLHGSRQMRSPSKDKGRVKGWKRIAAWFTEP